MLVIDCYYSHIFILFISFIYSMNKSHANHKSLCECAVINQTAIAPIFLLCLWKLKSEIQAMIPAIHVLQVLNQIHAILFSTVLTRVLFQIDRQINRFIIYVYVCPSRSVMSDSLRSHGLQPCRSPLSMGFSRQEYWSGLPFPSPGDLPDPAIQPRSPALQVVCLVKAMVFSVVMYGCESCTIKKAEHQRIDAFELWCWRRLLRVHWTARRSNQSILKEICGGLPVRG